MKDESAEHAIDSAIRRAFADDLPPEVEKRLQAVLGAHRTRATATNNWPYGSSMIWPSVVGIAASLLVAAGIVWMNCRPSVRSESQMSYIVAVATPPPRNVFCEAVFYADKERTCWTERRLWVETSQGGSCIAVARKRKSL